MDFDMFLTSPRWEILQIIAEKPASPVEIAQKLGTTISYISQQLKLLDAAGVVKKERTGAVERGKPRTLFSISNELAYITTLSSGFSNKKLVRLDEHHKAILKIWAVEDVSLHSYIERLYWKLEENLNEASSIFLDAVSGKIFISASKKSRQMIENYLKTLDRKLDVSFINNPIKSPPEGFDSLEIQINKLKGGK
jgi:predicted transcriptional regulator